MHSTLLGDEDDVPRRPPGHAATDLGPSDLSDTGSDRAGIPGDVDSDTDAEGTGERAGIDPLDPVESDRDVEPDRITDDPGGMLMGSDPEGVGVSSDHDRDRGTDDSADSAEAGVIGPADGPAVRPVSGGELGPDVGPDADRAADERAAQWRRARRG